MSIKFETVTKKFIKDNNLQPEIFANILADVDKDVENNRHYVGATEFEIGMGSATFLQHRTEGLGVTESYSYSVKLITGLRLCRQIGFEERQANKIKDTFPKNDAKAVDAVNVNRFRS